MRIVVWNCNMAFDRKYDNLLALQPDIAVISECADIELIAKKAPGFRPSSSIWIGANRQKGIGIFTFGAFKGRQRPIYEDQVPYFVPINIDGPQQFNLLAVWACHKTKNSYVAGLGPLKRAIRQYRGFIGDGPTVIAGDFNDNVLWDKPKKTNSFRVSVGELAALGLQSAYHLNRGVEHGNELEPTIYWRNRTADGPRYHIDYCFVPNEWAPSISSVTVGRFDEWVAPGLSDHVPIVVDLSL
jgi:exodeoxyribonuclease-3